MHGKSTPGRGRQESDAPGGPRRPPVAVVTGAATGIGAAVTRTLLSAGWDVVATRLPGQRGEPGTERAAFLDLDLTVPDAPDAIAARSAGRGVDLFVSSSGVSLPGPVELRADDVATEFAVNTAAPARVIAALLPQLRTSHGTIVLIGAGQGRVALPFGAGYAASKAGLAAIADALRAEVRDDGVSVSLIEPGAVRTAILATSQDRADQLLAGAPAPLRQRYEAPLKATLSSAARAFEEAMAPQKIADLVLQIAGTRDPKARYLIGREARALAVLAHLPAPWRAAVIRRALTRG